MKSFILIFIAASLLTTSNSCLSQKTRNTQDSITGIWKGTSLCEQKNGPCHDENVVFHISKAATANAYVIQASKIVNGEEQDMGNLDFVYDRSKQTLTCKMIDGKGRESLWKFFIKDDHISGTLMHGDVLFRKIELKKL